MLKRDISLARYRATTSAEARERVRQAMAAHRQALAETGKLGKCYGKPFHHEPSRQGRGARLTRRQFRASDERQACADFAMIAHDESSAEAGNLGKCYGRSFHCETSRKGRGL